MSKFRIVKGEMNGKVTFTVQYKETCLFFWRWTSRIKIKLENSSVREWFYTDTTSSTLTEAQEKLESIIAEVKRQKKVPEKVVYAVTVSDGKETVTFKSEQETDQAAVYM
jgi:predicted DNA binding protein